MSGLLLLPVALLMLVIVQTTALDLLTLSWIRVEVSLVVVIFSGFHHRLLQGALLSLLLGFFLDCLTSPIFGLHIFLYLLIFFLARIAAERVYGEKPMLVAALTVFCGLLEGLLIVLLYHWLLGANILSSMPRFFIPKAVLTGFLSPFIFAILQHTEALFHAKVPQPSRSLRSE